METKDSKHNAQIRINFGLYMPHPENPEFGSFVEPPSGILVSVPQNGKMPPGTLLSVRKAIETLIAYSQKYKHPPLPKATAPDAQKSLIETPDKPKVTGQPSVEIFMNDGAGNMVPLPANDIDLGGMVKLSLPGDEIL